MLGSIIGMVIGGLILYYIIQRLNGNKNPFSGNGCCGNPDSKLYKKYEDKKKS